MRSLICASQSLQSAVKYENQVSKKSTWNRKREENQRCIETETLWTLKNPFSSTCMNSTWERTFIKLMKTCCEIADSKNCNRALRHNVLCMESLNAKPRRRHEFLSTKKLLPLPFLRNKALNIQTIQPIQKWLSKSRRGVALSRRLFLYIRAKKKPHAIHGLFCVLLLCVYRLSHWLMPLRSFRWSV